MPTYRVAIPLVSDGPCHMHTPTLMLEKKNFDVLSLYRIEPRPYEEMEYWYRFYYDSDYSNVLSVDKSYGNSFYDNSSKEKGTKK